MIEVRVGMILGSTRPGRGGDQVANWVLERADARSDAEFELVDLADFALPLLDEAVPAEDGPLRAGAHRGLGREGRSFDAFMFVTPEYNHSTSGALKNALDFLYREWNDKAAGIVSYGAAGGTRAVEHLRLMLGELHVARRAPAGRVLAHDRLRGVHDVHPGRPAQGMLGTLLDQLVPWGTALQGVRQARNELDRAA